MISDKKFIIIDGPAVMHRAWHALPKLIDPKGRVISAVYGFVSVLIKLLRKYQPQYLVVTFDTPVPTFRHQEYPEYKATRIAQPQEFYDQYPIAKASGLEQAGIQLRIVELKIWCHQIS